MRYLYQSVSKEELVALYRACDVMLVTPLRDGMNLVAKEFVASRTDLGGALVLSEFAGAAETSGSADGSAAEPPRPAPPAHASRRWRNAAVRAVRRRGGGARRCRPLQPVRACPARLHEITQEYQWYAPRTAPPQSAANPSAAP